MDNYSIKSVTFGGFDKQDVVRYIEQAAAEAAAAQKALQEENDALRNQMDSLAKEHSALQAQAEELTKQKAALQELYDEEHRLCTELEQLRPLALEHPQLKKELEALRPDAEAYAQFRENIGAIECEARERAAALEAKTIAQLQQTVDLFRGQYQVLMDTFERTATHVSSELRKMEVNLSQLPRAMDQAGNELNILAAQLKEAKDA